MILHCVYSADLLLTPVILLMYFVDFFRYVFVPRYLMFDVKYKTSMTTDWQLRVSSVVESWSVLHNMETQTPA